ncbi:GIY-YIG nuclease family protein [Pyrococcus abyssi]|uniref:Archaeal endonuclease, putative n=1 Tax=Pyrococcus abyssi (strain GE5 / Orsay) TaxID=272844 RepID=Q9UYT5_PYRAB|nr:DUF123 domain-containing protein [Pyrococcus abyssi]CAB50327.1 Archaeal endonuclease, putative [Pyrococcus abyssi GE5]CCE70867.1 TPA: putative endonuclease [Pyrococcus abyssi GE5]
MRGSYFLVLYLPIDSVVRTKSKEFHLSRGYYVYVGSAMNSLEKRVERHFSKKKKLHWHIDYLLEKAIPLRAYLIPSDERLEEELSVEVSKYGEAIDGFGASDLKVRSNLYRFENAPDDLLKRILKERKLEYKVISSAGGAGAGI